VAGRTTHPVSLQPGGVSMTPPTETLLGFREELDRALEDLQATAALLASFEIPAFERETEFVSLKGEGRYPFIGGALVSSDGVLRDEDEYLAVTNEEVVEGNTTKWTRLSRDSYAVGPLARLNNNFELLHAEARRVAADFGLEPVCHRPFMAHAARLVECVHCVHEAMELIDEIVAEPDAETMAEVEVRPAEGVGAVEAPRGVLFHHYRFDGDGRIDKANCVVPSTQNNGNIHRDLPALVDNAIAQGINDDRQLELVCSMLVRSYDPCLSCSVH
jgi:coenzyme F420-reducing hydrogenase alpha subunit